SSDTSLSKNINDINYKRSIISSTSYQIPNSPAIRERFEVDGWNNSHSQVEYNVNHNTPISLNNIGPLEDPQGYFHETVNLVDTAIMTMPAPKISTTLTSNNHTKINKG